MYMQDWLPADNGTGPNNRILSNLRAYIDLGFEVEVVCFQLNEKAGVPSIDGLENVRWTFVPVKHSDSVIDRIGYLSGLSEERAMNYRFKSRRAIRNSVESRIRKNPNALHHFESLTTACAIINLPNCKSIWSMLDLESRFAKAHQQIRAELPNGRTYRWEKRAMKYLEFTERKTAAESKLTLCIARHETDFLRNEWNCKQAEFFPMSIPHESYGASNGRSSLNGKLRVLHLGRIDSLPSYRSLEYLFEQVLPSMPGESLAQMEILVAGECPDTPKARRIREIAAIFSFVKFLGFQADLKSLYSQADLQVVASTTATGLRTRIVESFAYNVPVLSSTVGAEGVQGLANRQNIVLADTPEDFCSSFQELLMNSELRRKIAEGGRQLYENIYSRRAVAERLSGLLSEYCGVSTAHAQK